MNRAQRHKVIDVNYAESKRRHFDVQGACSGYLSMLLPEQKGLSSSVYE
jgi:hypothetical protein